MRKQVAMRPDAERNIIEQPIIAERNIIEQPIMPAAA
jgi:hypothetical protein